MNKLKTEVGRQRPIPCDSQKTHAEMPVVLLFRFAFSGPWGEELAQASQELASDIALEQGLIWKIWLENRETGQAGGLYLFEAAAEASRYREKHEQRLAAMGLNEVTVDLFFVNTGLSALTMALAALGEPVASEILSTATVTMRS